MRSQAVLAAARMYGDAMADGSFLITGEAQLRDAVENFGSVPAESRVRVRNHIKRRAAALELSGLLPAWWQDTRSDERPEALFRDYSSEQREKFAKSGVAMPGGRYPIANEQDLKNAVKAYGRGNPKDRAAIRRHIIKRAKALGKSSLLPDDWK
jgi:hypothetical protein